MPSLDTNVGRFTEYQVIGRKLPTEKEPEPKLYRMVRRRSVQHPTGLQRRIRRRSGENWEGIERGGRTKC